jgi:hypothetical protein
MTSSFEPRTRHWEIFYRALASLRQTVLPTNPRQYALLAEGPLDEIRKLQSEIDAYLSQVEEEAEFRTATALRETPPS